ncbi:MAG: nucleotidyltransferase family protein [Chloroflexi bacterium]|nr:nucleotidyltransferase family protein [Chloroflexota bacterium]
MQIAAVILAAGAATRFGSPKQLARIGHRTVLEMVADVALLAGLQPVIAVVPPGIAVPATVVPEINDAPSDGLSRSLRIGLAAVPVEVDAAVILLGDQPTMAPATIRLILGAAGDDRPVVAASATGRIGPPILLRREAFALADEVTGDEGLHSILSRHPDLVTVVEVGEHVPDVDTREDLASLGEG